MKKKAVVLANGSLEIAEQIKEARGHFSLSETVRFALYETHRMLFPPYIKGRTAQEKAEDRLQTEKIKRELALKQAIDKQRAICSALGGEEVSVDGVLHCKYKMYEEVAKDTVEEREVQEAMQLLRDDTPNYQYRTLLGETGEEAKRKLKI